MGKINLLSFEVANLIAAGEVVDRPASAIKEMMENSIDAGAKRITVEVQNGGSTFMRVSDDGCGMDPEDLPLCIRRHATSKIETAADLDGICTLGFRGEALAAISAVARVRIISKTRQAYLGAVLNVDYGEIAELCEQGCSDGTTIIVEDLFANVPARRKFLKRDVTETAAVTANVERVALSHPEISFKLITDGQLKLDTAGDGKLANTIYSVFGKDFASKLIPVQGEYEGISVSGFVGRSDNVKGNRNYQNFYINNRYIKSKTASAALEQAFSSYLPAEKFPVCVLFISMNPGRVDVNVHPAKLEVKFSNEKIVFESIYYAVKQALESNTSRPQIQMRGADGKMKMSDSFVPVERGESLKARQITLDIPGSAQSYAQNTAQMPSSVTVKQEPDGNKGFANAKVDEKKVSKPERISAKEYLERYVSEIKSGAYVKSDKRSVLVTEPPKTVAGSSQTDIALSDMENAPTENKSASAIVSETPVSSPTDASECEESDNTKRSEQYPQKMQKPQDTPAQDTPEQYTSVQEIPTQKKPAPVWKIAGEVFNSYIIVEIGEKVLFVDKHAAHERILYEKLKANMYSSDIVSQLLMIPVEIMLMSDEVATVEEYRPEIEAVGFEFETSKNFVSIQAIPSGIEQEAIADMFAVIADRIKSGTGNAGVTRNILFEKALYQASCKAAIKAGREYSDKDNEWIIGKLMEIPDITVCPHGRPVAMEMSKKNIDRQFERT